MTIPWEERRSAWSREAASVRRRQLPTDPLEAAVLQPPDVAAALAAVRDEPEPVPEPESEHVEDAVFVTLREFLDLKFPPAESLVGVPRGGTNLLPRFGWVLPWGIEGCGKTSIFGVDLLVHAACGRDWLGYLIARPLRFVAIANEGVPGGWQDKLAEKLELWDGDEKEKDAIVDGIAIYVSPWGSFDLRNERHQRHFVEYARDHQADYGYLDPLHTIGTTGAGSPQETEEFKHLLRKIGLWDWLGFITPHHGNRQGMVSGDWGRHPDTLIKLVKDGGRPATKWTLQKARPADPLELDQLQILVWDNDTKGYHFEEVAKASTSTPEEVRDRVSEWLNSNPGRYSTTEVDAAVKGTKKLTKPALLDLHKTGEILLFSSRSGQTAISVVEADLDYLRLHRRPMYWEARNHPALRVVDSDPTTPDYTLFPTPKEGRVVVSSGTYREYVPTTTDDHAPGSTTEKGIDEVELDRLASLDPHKAFTGEEPDAPNDREDES